jgi:rubredoxin
MATEFHCPACDWIGSPPEKPPECPNCGSPDLEDLEFPEDD